MNVIILAAGYGERLSPLTKNKSKTLIEFNHKPLIIHLLDNLAEASEIEKIIIVVNDKYASNFMEALKDKNEEIIVHNDLTRDKKEQKPVVHTVLQVIDRYDLTREDLFILGADNYLTFSLTKFISFFKENKTSSIMHYVEHQASKLKKTGVIKINEKNQVLKMEEKPEILFSNLAVPPFYIFKKEDLPVLKKVLLMTKNKDSMGSIIETFCQYAPVKSYNMPSIRYDIGDLGSYIKALYSVEENPFDI